MTHLLKASGSACIILWSMMQTTGCTTAHAPDRADATVPEESSRAAAPRGDAAAALDAYTREQGFLRRFGRDESVTDVRWSDEACYIRRGARWERIALSDGSISSEAGIVPPPALTRPAPLPRVQRGRQRSEAPSPCGMWIAACVDHNVVIRPVEASPNGDDDDTPSRTEHIVTDDGTPRIGYGRASWVYGEELSQDSGMWWSPCSTRLAFYRFDDSDVPDFHLVGGWTRSHTTVLSEPYPKPGDPNPVAEILIYDLPSGQTMEVDVRALADPEEPEFYIYRIQFSPDGSSLLFHRLNRHQNHLELMACDPLSGDVRRIARERQATWQDYRPTMRFLDCGTRFLWQTDRSGFSALELRDLEGRRLALFEVAGADIDAIDAIIESPPYAHDGAVLFSAFGADDPHDRHPWVAPLDGSAPPRRLLDGPGRHDVRAAPDGRHLLVTRQAVDRPADALLLRVEDSMVLASLSGPSTEALTESGRALPQRITVLAADGTTPLHGVLYTPANVTRGERRPLVVQIYGGPGFRAVSGRFVPGNAATAFGWYVMQLDGRGASGRGKEFMGEVYLRLGEVEVDDHAAAVRQLIDRLPGIDPERIGIFGHSYGGYAVLMAMLRHPDLFRAGVAGAPVTDWRQYDTIYTERYMRTPSENRQGYDTGSAVVHAEKLEGDLLILHGMVDDNVHPNNIFAMMRVLQQKDLPFTLMVYPDAGHGLPGHAQQLRWRFLVERLGGGGEE